MPEADSGNSSGSFFAKDGWCWFLLASAAQAYLTFILALAAIATIPMIFGWEGSVVQSGSMEPKIKPGDVVLSTELAEDSPVPIGGVVEFTRPATEGDGTDTVLHRIVHDNEDGTYVTAGDANPDVDSQPITREQITGQARLLIPFVGLPGLWASNADLAPLAIWSALTLLAIGAAAAGLTTLRHRDGEAASELKDGGESEASNTEPAAAARRTVMAVAGASVAAGLMTLPRSTTTAAFTARTTNVNNTWTVRTLPPLSLGRLSPYALFAGQSISNIGPRPQTSITGGVGTSPGTSIINLDSRNVSGSIDRNTEAARNAKIDAAALYTAIDARKSVTTLNPNLTGTQPPGVYVSSTGNFTVSGTLTLDARGDPTAIFIFKGATITVAANTQIKLVNGASASNIYWKATDTVTLKSNNVSAGNFLAGNSAVAERTTDLTGRLVALHGKVTVDWTTVRLPQ